jgi:hypothetical protein
VTGVSSVTRPGTAILIQHPYEMIHQCISMLQNGHGKAYELCMNDISVKDDCEEQGSDLGVMGVSALSRA